jgi:hypothetical protein
MSAKSERPNNFFMPYWQVMVSNGDGSASIRLFSTQKLAEAYAEAEPEPFCDAVYPPRNLFVDDAPYKR